MSAFLVPNVRLAAGDELFAEAAKRAPFVALRVFAYDGINVAPPSAARSCAEACAAIAKAHWSARQFMM
jgi:hypothetical protein